VHFFLKPALRKELPLSQVLNANSPGKKFFTISTAGLYQLDSLELTQDLTLTAARPGTILSFTDTTRAAITTTGNLTLKNLVLRLETPSGEPCPNLISTSGRNLTFKNCRIEQSGTSPFPLRESSLIKTSNSLTCLFENTAVISYRAPLFRPAKPDSHLTINNSIIHAASVLQTTVGRKHKITFDHATTLSIVTIISPHSAKPTDVISNHSHHEAHNTLLWIPEEKSQDHFTWQGEHNTYATKHLWLSNSASIKKRNNPSPHCLLSFQDWKSAWQSDRSSREVEPTLRERHIRESHETADLIDLKLYETPNPSGGNPALVGPR